MRHADVAGKAGGPLGCSGNKLAESPGFRELLALVASRTDNAVIITDAGGLIEWVNEGFTRIMGYECQEVVGKESRAILGGAETDGATLKTMEEHVAGGKACVAELAQYSKSGQVVWMGLDVQPLREEGGKVTRVLTIARDITMRKHSELELRQAKAAAESANRAKAAFLASMSHEIRTPLNGVTGMMALLMNTPLDERQQHYLQIAQSSTGALLHLLDDILDYSSIESGHFQLHAMDFDLPQLLEELTATFSHRAGDKSLELQCHIAAEMAGQRVGDPARLRQILINLLSNAVKFTETGVIVVRAEVATGSATEVRFTVSDTGIGIPADRLGCLFQSFTQVDNSTTRKYGGTGLGLALCKHLAEMMGGHMGVESQLGRGSTFWFTVPLPVAETLNLRIKKPALLPTTRYGDARILLAEDNEINQLVAADFLLAAGYHHVDIVANGKQALEALYAKPYDLVLMDCQMPEMDGYQASRLIRAREMDRQYTKRGIPHVPIIALTANALRGDRELCLAAGMDAYLSKPLDPQAFTGLIESTLAGNFDAATFEAPALLSTAGLGSTAEAVVASGEVVAAVEPEAVIVAPAVAAVAAAPAFNLLALHQRYGDKTGLLVKLLQTFQKQTGEALRNLQSALDSQDGANLARVAHSLKGAAAYVAADRIAALTREMEAGGRAGELGPVKEQLAQLAKEIEQCVGEIPSVLTRLQESTTSDRH